MNNKKAILLNIIIFALFLLVFALIYHAVQKANSIGPISIGLEMNKQIYLSVSNYYVSHNRYPLVIEELKLNDRFLSWHSRNTNNFYFDSNGNELNIIISIPDSSYCYIWGRSNGVFTTNNVIGIK